MGVVWNMGIEDQECPSTELKQYFSPSKKKTIIQMAKRLGLLSKLGGFNNSDQEFWSNPWADLVRSLYEKRFGVGGL